MHQQYKHTVEKQHVPEHLIKSTVTKMQEERDRKKSPLPVKGLAAAACLVLVAATGIAVSRIEPSVSFYQIEENGDSQLNFGLIQMNKQRISAAELIEYAGWKEEGLEEIEPIEVVKEAGEIRRIEGELRYLNEYKVNVVMDSRMAAERYAGEKPLVLGQRKVYFAADQDYWYAFYEERQEKYLLKVSKDEMKQQKQFVRMIKKVL